MTPALDATRYEIKFVAPIAEAYLVESWVYTHPAAFRVAYPARQVNNIYFDNATLTALEENFSGISERTKVRFRWYGGPRDNVSGKLELKFRNSRVGWKKDYPVVDLPLAERPWREIARCIREQLPGEGRIWLDDFNEPVMFNSYTRKYLVSRDGNIRVTLDTNFRAVDQRNRTTPNFVHNANIPALLILEVKAATGDHDQLSRAVRDVPVRVGRFSKYATGLANMLE